MPNNKLPRGALAEATLKIAEKNGTVDRDELAKLMGTTVGSADQTLYRLANQGRLVAEYYFGRDSRGHRVRRARYKLPTGKPRSRLSPEQREKQREYQRAYYRKKRAAGYRKPAGSLPWVKDGRQQDRRGHPKLPDRSQLLEMNRRLVAGMEVLFPNGVDPNEDFLAWLDWTKEIMRNA